MTASFFNDNQNQRQTFDANNHRRREQFNFRAEASSARLDDKKELVDGDLDCVPDLTTA